METCGVKDAADIYTLHTRRTELADLILSGKVKLGEKRADKLLAAIEKRRKIPLSDFLGSLGVFGLGKRRVVMIQEAVPREFETLSDWLGPKLMEFAEAAGVPNIAARIHADLQGKQALIEKFLANGLVIVAPAAKPVRQAGSDVFCITGSLSKPKAHFESLILQAGQGYTDTFSREVTVLIAADPNSGSSKLQKARKQGVKIISEGELLQILKLERPV